MASDVIKVTVIDVSTPITGTLSVDKAVNDGNFTLTITTSDNLATDYKVYQNDTVVSQGKVAGTTTTVAKATLSPTGY